MAVAATAAAAAAATAAVAVAVVQWEAAKRAFVDECLTAYCWAVVAKARHRHLMGMMRLDREPTRDGQHHPRSALQLALAADQQAPSDAQALIQ